MDSKTVDICIVGGGASGLMAAIFAARKGASVLIVDKNEMLGRKLLSTGNGRCNFVNSDYSKPIDYYFHSSTGGLQIIDETDYQWVVDFMKGLGVAVKDIGGYYYPYTNQAKTVQQAFELEIKRLRIQSQLGTKVNSITPKADGSFVVKTNTLEINCKRVILATGGLAAPKLGSDGDGIRIAKKIGLEVVTPYPALVGLNYGDNSDFKPEMMAGVRCHGSVTFQSLVFDGEIQFNKDGISGYPVMCLSHRIGAVKRDKANDVKLNVNFIPEMSYQQVLDELKLRFDLNCSFSVKDALNGLLSEKVIQCLVDRAANGHSKNISWDTCCGKLDEDFINKLASLINSFTISISNTRGFNDAQTTGGGVACTQVDQNTMESRAVKGLYLCGELLDVDGICGGYNLHFAFKSGKLAGTNAAYSLTKI